MLFLLFCQFNSSRRFEEGISRSIKYSPRLCDNCFSRSFLRTNRGVVNGRVVASSSGRREGGTKQAVWLIAASCKPSHRVSSPLVDFLFSFSIPFYHFFTFAPPPRWKKLFIIRCFPCVINFAGSKRPLPSFLLLLLFLPLLPLNFLTAYHTRATNGPCPTRVEYEATPVLPRQPEISRAGNLRAPLKVAGEGEEFRGWPSN